MLKLRFAFTQIVSLFLFSFPPQTTPCCLEITVVQFSLGDGNVMGRWEVTTEKVLQNILQCSQLNSGYFVKIQYYPGCRPVYVPYKVAVFQPKLFFCNTGQFLLGCINAALRGSLVGLNEITGRLTCFMTMDHWLTFELHKNNHFYTKCFRDDTRQERGVRL